MYQAHPNPLQAAKGKVLPVAAPVSSKPIGLRETTRKPLIDELIEGREISFGFDLINVPDNLPTSTSLSAWCRLGAVDLQLITQDVFVNKITVNQVSADVEGTAAGQTPGGTPLAWGSKFGIGACIVVGSNLMDGKRAYRADDTYAPWYVAPCNLPGMLTGDNGVIDSPWDAASSLKLLVAHGEAAPTNFLASFDWTIGKLSDSQPFKQERTKSFGIFGKRIGRKENVEVYLVLRPGTLIAAVDGNINGYAKIDLMLGLTRESGTSRD